MRTLEQIIESCLIDLDQTSSLPKLEEEWNLYNETGFEQKARLLKPQLLFAKAGKLLGNPMMVKRPPFFIDVESGFPLPRISIVQGFEEEKGYRRRGYE